MVIRGVVQLGDDVRDEAGRRPLTGSAEAIRDDLGRLHEAGVTEVFLDLNFVPRVGSPDVDPISADAYAHEVLETFAPPGPERPAAPPGTAATGGPAPPGLARPPCCNPQPGAGRAAPARPRACRRGQGRGTWLVSLNRRTDAPPSG